MVQLQKKHNGTVYVLVCSYKLKEVTEKLNLAAQDRNQAGKKNETKTNQARINKTTMSLLDVREGKKQTQTP